MSARTIARRVWRYLSAADLPDEDRLALAEWQTAVHLTGAPTAAALLAAQIRAARQTATEGASMPAPDYRRLVDHLHTTDGANIALAFEITGPDTIAVLPICFGDYDGIEVTAAQLDELIAAGQGALDVLTPPAPAMAVWADAHSAMPAPPVYPVDVDADEWDDIAESMVTRLAANTDNAIAIGIEIALLDDTHRHALADALVIRAASILAAFRDHTDAGTALVTAATRDPATGTHPASNDYRQWRNNR